MRARGVLLVRAALAYSTFLGGSGADQGRGIAVDASGDAYVTGLTQSSDFPVKNASQSTYGGVQDAFVTALKSDGSGLLYSTYLGGKQADGGAGIAIDGNKNVYVTGLTGSTDFKVTGNASQPTPGGGNDAFVVEISSAGSLLFSTYLGGSGNEDSTTAGPSFSPVGAGRWPPVPGPWRGRRRPGRRSGASGRCSTTRSATPSSRATSRPTRSTASSGPPPPSPRASTGGSWSAPPRPGPCSPRSGD